MLLISVVRSALYSSVARKTASLNSFFGFLRHDLRILQRRGRLPRGVPNQQNNHATFPPMP